MASYTILVPGTLRDGTADNDTFNSFAEDVTMNGLGGDDLIRNSEGVNNVLNGGDGNDTMRGWSGDDFDGGADVDDVQINMQSELSDVIANLQGFGEAGGVAFGGVSVKNVETAGIALGSGNDKIWLGVSADFAIFLGDGADLAVGDNNNDEIAGGAGADSLHGGDYDDHLWAFGPASFSSYSGMNLDGFDDGTFGDRLYGGGEDDTLEGGKGNDTLDGGNDIDTASYQGVDDTGPGTEGVVVKLNRNIQENGAVAGTDRFISIENVLGSGNDDSLKGDEGDNIINGSRGNDTIFGGLGSDTLTGGDSNHADFFVYRSTAESGGASIDLITDLNFADRLDLHRIDAKEGKLGNQAFTVVDAFTGEEGELVRTFDGTLTIVELDTDGDTIADGYITMTGDVPDDFFIL